MFVVFLACRIVFAAGSPPIARDPGFASVADMIFSTFKQLRVYGGFRRKEARLSTGLFQLPGISPGQQSSSRYAAL